MGDAQLGLRLYIRGDLLGAAGKGHALFAGTGRRLDARPGDGTEPDRYGTGITGRPRRPAGAGCLLPA